MKQAQAPQHEIDLLQRDQRRVIPSKHLKTEGISEGRRRYASMTTSDELARATQSGKIMTANLCSHRDPRWGARVLHFASYAVILISISLNAPAQEQSQPPESIPPQGPVEAERWNLFYQATSIGQYHGTFHSPYSGPFSLQDYPERDVSLTTTLFLGIRLEKNTVFYFDPEIAGGKGFSGVDGLANSSNGELPRVASATPKPYLARLYISHDFGFGSGKESFESEENQLAGQRPMNRYTITAGRFTLTDFFDNNRYSHDPRTQFTGWAVMYNGAWDYP
ncbi:MAG: hypothetical protein M3N41_09345, partial [Acidobacteriota bacterium]|nr:hypothetical protein [Acidobacteriota bacterium]